MPILIGYKACVKCTELLNLCKLQSFIFCLFQEDVSLKRFTTAKIHIKIPGAFYTGFTLISCADPESFVSGGPNLIFLVDEGIQNPNTAINGPSSDGLKLNAGLFQGIGTSIAKKSLFLRFFT